MRDQIMEDKETIYEEITLSDGSPIFSRQRLNTLLDDQSASRHEFYGCNTRKNRCEEDLELAETEGRYQLNFPLRHDIDSSATPIQLSHSDSVSDYQDRESKGRTAGLNDRSMVVQRYFSCEEPIVKSFEPAMLQAESRHRPSLYRNGAYPSEFIPKRSSLLRELLTQDGEKTEYAEILSTTPVTEIALTSSRATRESDNPLLREDVLPSPSTSVPCFIPKEFDRASTEDSTTSYDSGIQEDSGIVYENASTKPGTFPRSLSDTPVYENASRPTVGKTTSLHRIESLYENMEDVGLDRRNSLPEGKIYENMSLHRSSSDTTRPRSSSKPIEIRYSNSPRRSEKELLYSDLDFGNSKTHRRIPSGGSHSSCSSPVSLSSSMSSLSSNSASASVSPPPPIPLRPPSMRRRPGSAYFAATAGNGISCYGALYVGAHPVLRITTEAVDSALRDVVHRAKMRELRSVFVDLSSEGIKLGSTSTSEDFSVSFTTQDVHLLQLHPKDCRVFGIVCSRPKEDGVCYVLRSEQSMEILESWKEQLLRFRPKISMIHSMERPMSVVLDSQQRSRTSVIKVGVMKVKKSYLVINESISALLGRTNPRDFQRVNFDVEPRCITTSNCETGAVEDQHVLQWILSLGVYNDDNRYFGYIVSDAVQGSKTKMYCYVYRCSYVLQARSILETIRSAHQNTKLLLTSQISTSPRYITNPQPKFGEGSLKRFGSKLGLDKSSNDSKHRSSVGSFPDQTHKGRLEKTPEISTTKNTEAPLKRFGSKLGLDRSNNDSKHRFSVGLFPDQTYKEKSDKISDVSTFKNTEAPLKRFGSLLGLSKTYNAQPESPREENTGVEEKTTPKPRQRLFSGALIRRKISKESQSSVKVCNTDIDESPGKCDVKEAKFPVTYLCSTIVNPPLRPKHVKECFRQYQKEISKAQKAANAVPPNNTLELYLSPQNGVQILDPCNTSAFRKEFPWCSVDRFIGHPENLDCFAFSTTVSGNSKHKCHVFCRVNEPVAEIQRSFESLLSRKVSA